MTRRMLPLALVGVVVAGVLSVPFFVQPLRPGPDQGPILQAAVRHARGDGLTVLVPDERDLTAWRSEPLTSAAPLYPLAVSAGLRHLASAAPRDPGASLGRAVARLVKGQSAAALVLGVLGWCLLAAHTLGSRSLGTLFAGLLAVAGGATVPTGGSADDLLWAALPWWLGALLLADAAADERRFGRALIWALAAGLLGGLLVGVRWAAVFLAPAPLLFWLARALQRAPGAPVQEGTLPLRAGRRALGARLVLALAAAAPLAASFLLLTASPGLAGGNGSLPAAIEPGWNGRRLAALDPIEALFSVPLALEPLLTRVWRAFEPARASPGWGLLFRLLLPLAALLALWRTAQAPGRPASGVVARRVRTLGAATLVALLVFLAWTTLRRTWPFAGWTDLDGARCYRPVWPLAALVWLSLLDRLPAASRFRTAAAALLLAGLLYLLQAQGRLALSNLGAHDESWELVARVRALERRAGLQVVLDDHVSDYVIAAGPRLVARRFPDPEQAARLVAGRPAELWLVRRRRAATPHASARDGQRFEAVRARFGARREWVSSGANFELWHAIPGEHADSRRD